MTRHKIILSSLILSVTASLLFLAQSAIAGYYEYDYFYTPDRMSREHRLAGDVDDWIERGNSTVTASPLFADGIRLAAWANEYNTDETYEFGIASAVYLFEIPKGAQSIEIKVGYKGETHEGYLKDYGPVAGRVWIRNLEKEREYRYKEGDTNTLYGDTFVLRADRRSETIKISAADHVDNDSLELHVVAENGELIDVDYIDVMTYRRQPRTRIIQYTGTYEWNPWYDYTYAYFYGGPYYYVTDYGYYVCWNFPIYDPYYIIIRRNYRRYLDGYRRRHGVVVYHYYRPVRNVGGHYYVRDRAQTRKYLTKWTDNNERVRHEYSQSRYTKRRPDRANIQTDVRLTIEKHRRAPVLTDREIQSKRISLKRRRNTTNEIRGHSPNMNMKTWITPFQSDNNRRYERSIQIKTRPPKVGQSRTILRRRRTEASQKRRTEVKSSSSQTAKITKTKKKDDDDDEDKKKKEEEQRREARKKRR